MTSNLELVDYLVESGVLKTTRLIETFQKIDRADFAPREYRNEAYEDHPLPIGFGQTISQPWTVAFMLELLAPEAGERVLDVGCGSGYTTALLARAVGERGEVFGVEVMPQLVEFARSNLSKYDPPWAAVFPASDHLGLSEKAPFNKILVSAAARQFPSELLDQLALGGRLVVPVQNSIVKADKSLGGGVRYVEYPTLKLAENLPENSSKMTSFSFSGRMPRV